MKSSTRKAALLWIALLIPASMPGACPDCPLTPDQEVLRAMFGFEQAGASGAASGQNFVFDLFLSRPVLSARIRWWGDVKVAGFPQQVNSQIAQFAQQFSSSFGGLTVNRLAASAEFATGPEFVVAQRAHSALAMFLGGGAIGPNNPSDAAPAFQIPDAKSPQYQALVQQIGAIPAGSSYLAFLPQSDGRFSREWQAGLRLYTSYQAGSPPGSIRIFGGPE